MSLSFYLERSPFVLFLDLSRTKCRFSFRNTIFRHWNDTGHLLLTEESYMAASLGHPYHPIDIVNHLGGQANTADSVHLNFVEY